MPSSYSEAADALKIIIDAEFVPEGYTAIHDNLHAAVGMDSGTRIGIAPEAEIPASNNMYQQDTTIIVKFYRRWDPEVEPLKKVDPRPITEFAERLRDAIRRANVASTGRLWYFNLDEVRYPDDPTGNKTRFVARLTAYGNNTALVETTG